MEMMMMERGAFVHVSNQFPVYGKKGLLLLKLVRL